MNASGAESGIVDYLCAAYLLQGIDQENGAAVQARSIAAIADVLGSSYDIAIPETVQAEMLARLAADGVVEPVQDVYAQGFFFTTEQGLRDAWQRLYMRKGSVAENARRLGNDWLTQVFANADFQAALAAAAGEEAIRDAEVAEAAPEIEADEAPADTSPDGEAETTDEGEEP
jgi:hypothetical protein